MYLIIKLDNDKIDLTNRISIPYHKTNLPKSGFKFRTHIPVLWKLEQKEYAAASGVLTVSVADYNLPATTTLAESVPQFPIQFLKFEKLDWKKFEPLVYTYTASKLKDIIFNYENNFDSLTASLKKTAPNLFYGKREPVKEDIEKNIRVKYEEATFDFGKINFTITLKPYKLKIHVEIINPHLRAEFEYVKSYFVKRLGKFFSAKVKIKLTDGTIEEVHTTSDEIQAIDEHIIDSIKTDSILDLSNLKAERPDKILYSSQDLLNEDKNLSLLDKSAEDILQVFIDKGKVRNARQLEYLARDRHTLNGRLQFTTRPLFGFVFFESANKQCYIWELLNSHATYVWKKNGFENEVDLGKIVEQAIAAIRTNGRQAYKKYYKTLDSPGYEFSFIEHSSNDLTEEERFSEWRIKLERLCS